jgi:hypothetical protein
MSIADIMFWTGLGGMTIYVVLILVLAYFSPMKSLVRPRQQKAQQTAQITIAGSGWTPEELAEIARLEPQLEAKAWEVYRRSVNSLKPDEELLVYSLVKLPLVRSKRRQGLPLTDTERLIAQFGDANGIP